MLVVLVGGDAAGVAYATARLLLDRPGDVPWKRVAKAADLLDYAGVGLAEWTRGGEARWRACATVIVVGVRTQAPRTTWDARRPARMVRVHGVPYIHTGAAAEYAMFRMMLAGMVAHYMPVVMGRRRNR